MEAVTHWRTSLNVFFGSLLLLEIFLMLKRQLFKYHLCVVSNCQQAPKILKQHTSVGKQTLRVQLMQVIMFIYFLADTDQMIFYIFGNEEKLLKKRIMWKITDVSFSDTYSNVFCWFRHQIIISPKPTGFSTCSQK